jgi:hypothetical protein
MRQPEPTFLRAALGAGALLISIAAAHAQTPGDQNVDRATASKQAAEIARGGPARWYQEDATAAARLRTLQKEIGAALHEAHNACRTAPTAERASCAKQARATYQQDMAGARQLVASGSPR